MRLSIRPVDTPDLAFMRDMLKEAATGPQDDRSTHDVLADPETSRYITGWGRPGDVGVVALDQDARRLGAAWVRLFDEDEPGYGFVDPQTPEISIAVDSSVRGQGVGGKLLDALLREANRAGFARVSLSVDASNTTALRLYRSRDFEAVARDDHGHMTMVASTS